ncbi:MAG: Ig-like domain-containing protein [Planctomycetaceae bacterium]|nr:Ig-like domain-containing protein [Planctomycetaceae bacterium]
MMILLFLSFSAPFLSGCGNKRVPPEGMPTLYRCLIRITQNDQPLADAVVALHSTSENFLWTINGRTDENGQAEIFTHGYFRGAPSGDFKVTVDKLETVVPPLPEVMPTSESELTKLFNKREEEIKEYRLVDIRFTQAELTPFSINVNKKMGIISLDLSTATN